MLVEAALRKGSQTPTERSALVTELYTLTRQITGIANNLNQIARATNATLKPQEGETSALAAAMSTMKKIDEALDRIGRRVNPNITRGGRMGGLVPWVEIRTK